MPHPGEAQIIRDAPYFLVPEVSTAGRYYQEVFGFHCDYVAGEPPEFAIYSRSGAAIMFRRAPDPDRICPNEKQGGTWDVFYWVEALDPLYDELKAAGATIVYSPVVQPYGMKEFAVRDPNGYVLGFGQEVSAAAG